MTIAHVSLFNEMTSQGFTFAAEAVANGRIKLTGVDKQRSQTYVVTASDWEAALAEIATAAGWLLFE